MIILNRYHPEKIANRFYKRNGSLVYILRPTFLIIAAISVTVAYLQLDIGVISYTPLFLALFWFVSVIENLVWFTDLIFIIFTILTSAGFIFHANQYLLLFSFFCFLIFWDLHRFLAVINPFNHIDQITRIVFLHLKTLALSIALSLIFIIFAWQIRISLSLLSSVILAGGAIMSLRWIISSLSKHLNE